MISSIINLLDRFEPKIDSPIDKPQIKRTASFKFKASPKPKDKTPKEKKKKPNKEFVNSLVISGPFNPQHKVHVDMEYNWSGPQNPAEVFSLQRELGRG